MTKVYEVKITRQAQEQMADNYLTVIFTFFVLPLATFNVIIAVPFCFDVTTPLAFTVATFLLLLEKV